MIKRLTLSIALVVAGCVAGLVLTTWMHTTSVSHADLTTR